MLSASVACRQKVMNKIVFVVLSCVICYGLCQDVCSSPYRFRCADNTCISIARTCDGKRDCPWGEDESYTHARCERVTACKSKNTLASGANNYDCRAPCTDSHDPCRGALKRCACDDECGYSCINPYGECPTSVPTIPNVTSHSVIRFKREVRVAVPDGSPYLHGDMISYTCSPGMILIGPLPRCDGRRQWSAEMPECIVDHCANQPCVNGGTCVNKKSDYTCFCRENFEGINCETIDSCHCNPCSNGGTCLSKGSKFTCTCPLGFVGSSCESVVTCGSPPRIDNGRWNTPRVMLEYPLYAMLEPVCHYGYYVGEAALPLCRDDGSWYPDYFECRKIQCSTPDRPEYGYIIDERVTYGYGETLEIACFENYQLFGNSTTTCIEEERWTEMESECISKVCFLDQYLLPVGISVQGFTQPQLYSKDFAVGELVTVSCNTSGVPYLGDSALKPPRLRCGLGGRWAPAYGDLYCGVQIAATCKFPLLPKGMILQTSDDRQQFDIGSQIRLRCDQNMALVGADAIMCQADGTWSMTGNCESIRCHVSHTSLGYGVSVSMGNGSVMDSDGTFDSGETLDLSCSEPMKQPFVESLQRLISSTSCADGGQWYPSIEGVLCVNVCVEPPEEENGMLVVNRQGVFHPNQTITAECPPNYRHTGSNFIKCLGDGTWSSGDGCEPIGCWIDAMQLDDTVVIAGHTNESISGVEFAIAQALVIECLQGNQAIENNLPRTISCMGKNLWSTDYRQYRCGDSQTCEGRCLSVDAPCSCDFGCRTRGDCCGDFEELCVK